VAGATPTLVLHNSDYAIEPAGSAGSHPHAPLEGVSGPSAANSLDVQLPIVGTLLQLIEDNRRMLCVVGFIDVDVGFERRHGHQAFGG
jgi:hypothetical protein